MVNILQILTHSNEAMSVIPVERYFVLNTSCHRDLYQVYYHSIAAIRVHVGHQSEDTYIHVRLDVIMIRRYSYKESIHHSLIWLAYSIVDSIQLNHHSFLKKHQLHIIHIHSLSRTVTLHVLYMHVNYVHGWHCISEFTNAHGAVTCYSTSSIEYLMKVHVS